MPKVVDITGERFGLLRIRCRAKTKSSSNTSSWEAQCNCGNKITVTYAYLLRGNRNHKSCGCAVTGFMADSQRKRLAAVSTREKKTINSKRSKTLRKFWNKHPEERDARSIAVLKSFAKNNTRDKLSKNSTETWKDPAVRASRVKGLTEAARIHPNRTDEGRLKISKSRKALFLSNPSLAADIRARKNTPENLAKASACCKSQRSKKSKPEAILDSQLDGRMFKYAGLNTVDKGQPISADFVSARARLIIQVDGCYWHECPKHGSGAFPRKSENDAKLTKYAQDCGWTVLRFWEHDILKDMKGVLKKINRTYHRLLGNRNTSK